MPNIPKTYIAGKGGKGGQGLKKGTGKIKKYKNILLV